MSHKQAGYIYADCAAYRVSCLPDGGGPYIFFQNVLQDVLIQTEVRNQLFQLPVFIFKLLQTPQLSDAQTAVYLLPTIERLLRKSPFAE